MDMLKIRETERLYERAIILWKNMVWIKCLDGLPTPACRLRDLASIAMLPPLRRGANGVCAVVLIVFRNDDKENSWPLTKLR